MLGTVAYGGPVVAGGRVFVGTNNEQAARQDHQGRQGRADVLPRAGRQVPLAERPRQARRPATNDYGRARHRLHAGRRGQPVYYVSNRCEVVCADVAGDQATGKGQDLWTLDMIKDLRSFRLQAVPTARRWSWATWSSWSPATASIRTRQAARAERAELHRRQQEDRQGRLEDNSPGQQDHGRPMVQPGGASRSTARRKSSSPAATAGCTPSRPKTGKLLWKFDCNPKERSLQAAAAAATATTSSPRRSSGTNKLYIGVGQEPDDGHGVGHLWCIDITKKPKNKDKDLSPVNDNFDPKAAVNKNSGLVWHFGGAGHAQAGGRQPRVSFRPHHQHRGRPRRPGLRRRAGRLPQLPGRQDRQKILGVRPESDTWARPSTWTARSTWAPTTATCSSSTHGKRAEEAHEDRYGRRS